MSNDNLDHIHVGVVAGMTTQVAGFIACECAVDRVAPSDGLVHATNPPTVELAQAWIAAMARSARGGVGPISDTMEDRRVRQGRHDAGPRGLERKTFDPYPAGGAGAWCWALGHLPCG
jgi:hypothetical protein